MFDKVLSTPENAQKWFIFLRLLSIGWNLWSICINLFLADPLYIYLENRLQIYSSSIAQI